jgi:hypothetical protein
MAMADTALRPSAVIAAVLLAGAAGAAAVVPARGQWSTVASATPAAPVAPAAAPSGTTVARASHAVVLPPGLVPTGAHSVKELMAGLVDPAADGIWNSAGSIATSTGEETWAPSSDEDWRRLEGHARALARGADALIQPARVNGRPDWVAPARALRVASDAALGAAQRRDVGAIYAASEGLLDACQQCHKRYWLPTESAP